MNKNNTSTHITNTPLTIIYFWLDYITVYKIRKLTIPYHMDCTSILYEIIFMYI